MSRLLASMRRIISPIRRRRTPSPLTNTSVCSIFLPSYQLTFFSLCTVAQYGQVFQAKCNCFWQFSQGFLRSQPHSGQSRNSFSTIDRHLGHRLTCCLSSLSSTATSSSRSRESSRYSGGRTMRQIKVPKNGTSRATAPQKNRTGARRRRRSSTRARATAPQSTIWRLETRSPKPGWLESRLGSQRGPYPPFARGRPWLPYSRYEPVDDEVAKH